MPKDTAIDWSLVSTEELMTELSSRHEEIIIIRENLKKPEWVDIWTKTAIGELYDQEIGFDIFFALELLHTAEKQMLMDYLRLKRAEENGCDGLPDNDSGS